MRVILDGTGVRLHAPLDRNLWDAPADARTAPSVIGPVDPAEIGVDPLTFLPARAGASG